MAALTIILVALQLASFASGKPNLAFPLNAQLPLAARLDTFFTYSFSPQTFISSSNITYSFGQNHPPWLSIESASRRLYGTPNDTDVADGEVVGQKVDIVATDDTGSTTMDSTLVISRKPAPAVRIPLEDQIKTFGNFSAPSSVLSYPATEFRYSFDQDTFGKNSGLNYYAVSSNHSPLPAWIQFDAGSMSFSGKTPPFESLVQPPQTFGLSLVASDIVGFAATSLTFNIVVGSHTLTTENPIVTLNATRGTAVNYAGLENAIALDGKPVKSSDLDVTTEDMPKWLNYDKDTGKLSGTPRDGDHSSNFTITYSNKLSATLDILVVVNVATGLFKSTFENMEARPGGKFDVDLSRYFRDPDDIKLNVTVSPTEKWLNVDGFKLSGNVPKDSQGKFDITVDASSKSSSLSEREKLHVAFLAPDGTPTSTSVRTSSPTSTPTPTNTASESPSPATGGRLSTGDILLATIIPILFIALILMLFVCFLRRRRASRSYLSSKARSKISNPIGGLMNGSSSSLRRTEKMTVVHNNEKHMLKPTGAAYMEAVPRVSTARRSSETLGGSENYEVMPIRSLATRGQPMRNTSPRASNDGRRSWETVDGDAPFMSGAKSMHNDNDPSPRSSIPDSTHQVFPIGGYIHDVGPSGYKTAMGGITGSRDLAAMKASASAMAYGRRDHYSVDTYSTKTTSSVALPMNERGRNHRPSAPTIAESEASDPNWETITVSDVSHADVRPPDKAYLSAGNTGDIRRWAADATSNASRSLMTDPSFGSGENWRVVSKHDTATLSFKDIASDDAPYRPPSESREGAMPGERSSLPPAPSTPPPLPAPKSKWGEVGAEKKTKIHENMSVLSSAVSAWRKEDSGKVSDGSSFKVFI